MHRLTALINRMHILNLGPATQMAHDDVGRLNRIQLPIVRLWIIGRVLRDTERMGQRMRGQDVLNLGQTRRRVESEQLYIALNRARAKETVFRLSAAPRFAHAPNRNNHAFHVR